jgi:hypothetical protein
VTYIIDLNNKLHNEKTPQLTKGQRYDRLNRKSTFQTSWKEKIPWVEASGRQSNFIEIKLPKTFSALYLQRLDFQRHFLLCVFGSLISTRLPAIMLMRIMK